MSKLSLLLLGSVLATHSSQAAEPKTPEVQTFHHPLVLDVSDPDEELAPIFEEARKSLQETLTSNTPKQWDAFMVVTFQEVAETYTTADREKFANSLNNLTLSGKSPYSAALETICRMTTPDGTGKAEIDFVTSESFEYRAASDEDFPHPYQNTVLNAVSRCGVTDERLSVNIFVLDTNPTDRRSCRATQMNLSADETTMIREISTQRGSAMVEWICVGDPAELGRHLSTYAH